MLRTLAIVGGMAAEALGWWLIVRGRGSIWRTLIPVYCAQALLASALRPAELAGDRGLVEAIAIGVGSGLILYTATRGFVRVASRWGPFERAVAESYSQAEEVSTVSALVLSAVVAAPSEEIFWRGLVMGTLREHVSVTAAGTIAWIGYVIVKAC